MISKRKRGGNDMDEKIIGIRKNGMLALLIITLLYGLAIAGTIYGNILMREKDNPILLIVSIIWLAIGWFPYMGLKVIKPQEALVLTLFGKYVGTLKEDGFYFVNPFCTAINPAAKTKLSQSGDVNNALQKANINSASRSGADMELTSKKISLKIMTLNNI